MRMGGFQKFSLIDYPGKISCVIFTQGCNLRCPFCHNPELVIPEAFNTPIDEGEVRSFLRMRADELDGVVITGGEPTLHRDLADFALYVKELGFALKLDTNGSSPGMIAGLLDRGLVDYVAMDIKAPENKYESLAGVKIDTALIKKSIKVIRDSGIDHHFRTTLVHEELDSQDIEKIRGMTGGSEYVIQEFERNGRLVGDFLLERDVK